MQVPYCEPFTLRAPALPGRASDPASPIWWAGLGSRGRSPSPVWLSGARPQSGPGASLPSGPAPPPSRRPDAFAISTGGFRPAGNKIRHPARQRIPSPRDALRHVQYEAHYWLGHATHMEQEFTQAGGIRYGESFWYATNLTAPLALLRVSKDAIILSTSLLRVGDRTFTFPRSAIRRLRWKRGVFSRGLQIEHTVAEYPPFVLFWVGYRKTVAEGLRAFGYEI